MSNTELTTARDLIQEKRYAEARALLKTVDHPTAAKWLAKLDEISPEPIESTAIHSPTQVKGKVPWLSAISMIAIVFLTVMMIYQQIRLNNLIKYVGGLETDISTVRTSSASKETTDSLSGRVITLETNLSDLVTVVNSHASDINSLSYDLSSVSAIANNADHYAHSHGYSDLRLKTDIVQINNPLERILSLRGVSFTWNTQAYPDLHLEDGRDYGVLAQEVKAIFPELVTLDSESGMYRVDYQGLIPILIESIRQQQEQIDGLRLEISQTE